MTQIPEQCLRVSVGCSRKKAALCNSPLSGPLTQGLASKLRARLLSQL